jgi:hypothetical protein
VERGESRKARRKGSGLLAREYVGGSGRFAEAGMAS